MVDHQLKQIWAPVIEAKTEDNPKPYITTPLSKLLKTGDFADVPWLIGGNSQDGAYFKAKLLSTPELLEKFYKNIDKKGPKELLLSYSVKENEVADVWQNITDFYFGTKRPQNNTENQSKLIELFADRFALHSIHRAVVEHSKAGHEPIFYYNFGYHGIYSYADVVTTVPMDLGVVHSDELIYLVPSNIFKIWPPTHPDLEAVDKMVTLWTNFAIHGNPTPFNGTESGGMVWEPVGDLEKNDGFIDFLNITNDILDDFAHGNVTLYMDEDLYWERMMFMDSLPLRENQ